MKRKLSLIFLIATLLVMALATTASASWGTVTGYVYYPTLQAASGAFVRIDCYTGGETLERWTYANSYGQYSIGYDSAWTGCGGACSSVYAEWEHPVSKKCYKGANLSWDPATGTQYVFMPLTWDGYDYYCDNY